MTKKLGNFYVAITPTQLKTVFLEKADHNGTTNIGNNTKDDIFAKFEIVTTNAPEVTVTVVKLL